VKAVEQSVRVLFQASSSKINKKDQKRLR
jgi:hypothetical protein